MKHEKTFAAIAKLKDIEVELHRLKNALEIANKALDAEGEVYERGFIDGMQKQMQSSVDKAVNAMSKREWVGLTLDEIDLLEELYAPPVHPDFVNDASHCLELIRHVEAKLKEKNT
jgi:hypothetical protein